MLNKDTRKSEKARRASSGPTGANTRSELTCCDEQRAGRGGKTCRHNVGPTTRQLSSASFIIKRPWPRMAFIWRSSTVCVLRRRSGRRRTTVAFFRTRRSYTRRVSATVTLCILTLLIVTRSSLTATTCCDIVGRRYESSGYSGDGE